MDSLKITLPNGLEVSGNATQINELLEKMGFKEDGIHYRSATKGLIKISEMESTHIRNTILKLYREWLEEIKVLDNLRFLEALRSGASSPTMLGLVVELAKREKSK